MSKGLDQDGPNYWLTVALRPDRTDAAIIEFSEDCFKDDIGCCGYSFKDSCSDMSWAHGMPIGIYKVKLYVLGCGTDEDWDIRVSEVTALCQVAA